MCKVKMKVLLNQLRTKTQIWFVVIVATFVMMEVACLNGPNVCIVKQKYNITKRVKYRAPMSVRTYEWCFSMPPRCSRWNTEMRDLTRLETEERTAEMSVCCPGYKMRDVSCVPICPLGKTGPGCSEDCPENKWGPNCVHECKNCGHGSCSPITGECICQDGWQGESCETVIPITTPAMMEQLLTTAQISSTTKITSPLPTHPTTAAVNISSAMAPVITESSTTVTPTTVILSTTTSITTTKISTTTPTTPKIETVAPTTQTVKSSTTKPTTSYPNTTISTVTTLDFTPDDVTRRLATMNSEKGSRENKSTTNILETTTSTDFTTSLTTIGTTMATYKPVTTATTLTTESLKTRNTATSMKKESTTKLEAKKTESTVKMTTAKFKPKEIWIRPAQKGESTSLENKRLNVESHSKNRVSSKEITENTTPKTIIVSIIPTSVSYASFKKIALTTAPYMTYKTNSTVKTYKPQDGYTRPMTVATTTPYTIKFFNKPSRRTSFSSTGIPVFHNVTKNPLFTALATEGTRITTVLSNITNSMVNESGTVNSSNSLTTISVSPTNSNRTIRRQTLYVTTSKPTLVKSTTTIENKTQPSINQKYSTVVNNVTEIPRTTKTLRKLVETNKKNATNIITNPVTEDPTKDEETFHILTEPEHITAVMGEKEREKTSLDLVSVISIAGGIMMGIITVAVVIVMLERCKRPRYEDVRKYNDVRMQVLIDNDIPPPYVRSIFHTPLPDPPTSEKCHYQPISTLDRNLKQFMRPVVVQTISPLMLENFRGILECHYDHLPRRSHDMEPMQTHCCAAPSIEECEELLRPRASSMTDSTIEALKCEAKLDVIDNTTLEPLYAEIPCWRPPSEHAIEIVNLNGEAVTEL